MTCDDKKEAEAIISHIAMTHYAKLTLHSSSTTNSSPSQNSSSLNNQQDKQSNLLNDLFLSCGLSIRKSSTTKTNLALKPSAIKEEIARYIANHADYNSFTEYWEKNQYQLPILTSIVRKYNIMCATSIECESAFSIAGHVQRKNRSSLAPTTLRYSMVLREPTQT